MRPLLPQNLTGKLLDQRGTLLEPFVLRWVQQDLQAQAILAALPQSCQLELDYDELVAAPRVALTRVGRFLGLEDVGSWAVSAAALVTRRPSRATAQVMAEIESWRQAITESMLATGTYQPITVA